MKTYTLQEWHNKPTSMDGEKYRAIKIPQPKRLCLMICKPCWMSQILGGNRSHGCPFCKRMEEVYRRMSPAERILSIGPDSPPPENSEVNPRKPLPTRDHYFSGRDYHFGTRKDHRVAV